MEEQIDLPVLIEESWTWDDVKSRAESVSEGLVKQGDTREQSPLEGWDLFFQQKEGVNRGYLTTFVNQDRT